LLFFEDPLLEHSIDYYFEDYPKPLPRVPEGFCPKPEIDQISPILPSSGDKKFDAERDRFTGYNLPTVKLEDGFEYYVVGVHSFFINQPQFWQKPAFQVGFDTVGGYTSPIYSKDIPIQPKDIQDDPDVSDEETHHRSPNLPI